MRKRSLVFVALLLAVVATLAAAATAREGSSTAAPGVSRTSIKLGGTFPLSGFASIYGVIPHGMGAYFNYINHRKGPDGKLGIHGRKIVWKYYDDAYDPAQTVQFTHRLIEKDGVFAVVGSL